MSNFLLVVNASVVTITYGVMDVIYRTEFVAAVKIHFHYMLCLRCCQKTESERAEQNVCWRNLRRHTITTMAPGAPNIDLYFQCTQPENGSGRGYTMSWH